MCLKRCVDPLKLIAVAAVALPLLASGCKKKKDPNAPLEEMDLAAVCAGTPEPRAKAYDKDGPNAHGIVQFARASDDKEMESVHANLLSDFTPEKPQDVEIVSCAVRTSQTKAETCDYEGGHHVETYDATYEITIREARTGAVLQTRSVPVGAPSCAMFKSFDKTTEHAYPSPEHRTAELVAGLVVPREGGAPVPSSSFRDGPLMAYSLDRVCHGVPERRAAAYESAPGKLSPLHAFSRPNDTSAYGLKSGAGFGPWETKEPKDYQLVACITERSRTKTLSCKFDPSKTIQSADLYSATYEVTVREAKTAKIVATKTITEEGEKACPTWIPAIRSDIHHEDHVPLGGPATLDFVKPLVAP